jgi:signal transduction histidine kinase
MLEQLLLNILFNSIKYTEKGLIEVNYNQVNKNVLLISVQD